MKKIESEQKSKSKRNTYNESPKRVPPLYEIEAMNQTSMFANKYEEDTDLPTVANKLADIINELEKSFLSVRPIEEPSRMEEQRKRSLFLSIIIQKVLSKDLLDGIHIFFIVTTISHGTRPSTNIFQGRHRYLPHSRMRHFRTRIDFQIGL